MPLVLTRITVVVLLSGGLSPVSAGNEAAKASNGDGGAKEASSNASVEPTSPRSLIDYDIRKVTLSPAPERVTCGAAAGDNVWLGSRRGDVWRFDRAGKGQELVLPERRGVWRILAERDTATILSEDGSLFRASASGRLAEVGRVDPSFEDIVAVDDGFLGLREGQVYFVTGKGDGAFPLLFSEVEGSSVGKAGTAEARTTLSQLPEQGALLPIDGQRCAFVSDNPYEILVLGVDQNARRLQIDEGDFPSVEEHVLTFPPHELLRLDGPMTRGGHSSLGRLLVRREYRREYRPQDKASKAASGGASFTGYFAFIDMIDLATGRIVERTNSRGLWLGVSGDDLVFFGSDGPGGDTYLLFASMR